MADKKEKAVKELGKETEEPEKKTAQVPAGRGVRAVLKVSIKGRETIFTSYGKDIDEARAKNEAEKNKLLGVAPTKKS